MASGISRSFRSATCDALIVLRHRLNFFALALWWGSLTALGAWVVPILFIHMPSPAQAGTLAARLFSAQTWLGLICGLVFLVASRRLFSALAPSLNGLVLAAMLMALLLELAIAPRILLRENLALWHSLGSAMFLVQWACVGLALWKMMGQPEQADIDNQG